MPDTTKTTHFNGAELRRLRLARGWTLGYVAQQVGASFGNVAHWETGRNVPRWQLAVALAKLFSVPLDTFVAAK